MDDEEFEKATLNEIIEDMPDFLYGSIESHYGEVTKETCAKARVELKEHMKQMDERRREIDAMDYELSSEEREWRDLYEFLSELMDEEVTEITSDCCGGILRKGRDEARISQDGIEYTNCSNCGEEMLEEKYGRKQRERSRMFAEVMGNEKEFEMIERHSSNLLWEDEDNKQTIPEPELHMSDEVHRQLSGNSKDGSQ